jgi:hypothetical protein
MLVRWLSQRFGRQRLQRQMVVPQQTVAVQQPDDVLYATVVILRPRGGKGARIPGAPAQIDYDRGLVRIFSQGTEVGVAKPDVLDAAGNHNFEVAADAVERKLIHLGADRARAPFTEGATVRAAAAAFVGGVPV